MLGQLGRVTQLVVLMMYQPRPLSLLHHTTGDIKQNEEPPSVIQDNFPPRSACFVTQQLKPSLHLHCSLITGQKNVGTKPPPDNKYNFLEMRFITYNGN